jgi:bifunctional polynucleotide phosphatase/kinase
MEVYKIGKYRFRKKIAAFDYDWTIVKPKSGSTFPKNKDDWIWLRPNVPEILQSYYVKGFSIMIFTNQSKQWKIEQISDVLNTLNIPMIIVIAKDKDIYKPNPYIFTENVKKEWDKRKSFYCGDALGRAADWADSDRQFAENIGMQVKQPEEIFPFINIKQKREEIRESTKQEMIIMVGLPGSGKTTFAKKHFGSKYKIVSGDELKTPKNMIAFTMKQLQENYSVIIDATNPSRKKRAVFIEIAKKINIPVKCVHITTSLEESLFRNNERAKTGNGVPKIVYNVYKKHFEEPSEEEGCKVIKI